MSRHDDMMEVVWLVDQLKTMAFYVNYLRCIRWCLLLTFRNFCNREFQCAKPGHTPDFRKTRLDARPGTEKRTCPGKSGRMVTLCLFVCLFVNTITSERVNIGWWNLRISALHCTKISAEFEFGGHSPPRCASSKMCRSSYDVGKISAGCLVVL